MTFTEILLLAVGLSADAFSVAVCKGLSTKKFSPKMSVIVGLWFGFFQALMPAIGYFLGSAFVRYIEKFDHWIAFVLLAMIGVNMIRESFSKDEDDADSSLSFSSMLPLAVATSIDALAVGVAPLDPRDRLEQGSPLHRIDRRDDVFAFRRRREDRQQVRQQI